MAVRLKPSFAGGCIILSTKSERPHSPSPYHRWNVVIRKGTPQIPGFLGVFPWCQAVIIPRTSRIRSMTRHDDTNSDSDRCRTYLRGGHIPGGILSASKMTVGIGLLNWADHLHRGEANGFLDSGSRPTGKFCLAQVLAVLHLPFVGQHPRSNSFCWSFRTRDILDMRKDDL